MGRIGRATPRALLTVPNHHFAMLNLAVVFPHSGTLYVVRFPLEIVVSGRIGSKSDIKTR
jgi:hypothetical protein